MRGKLVLLALASFVLYACTVDLGYDPSSRYDDKPVEYIVKCGRVHCSSTHSDDNVPKCTKDLEGAIFFIEDQEAAYACIDGQWTEKRKMTLQQAEREGAKEYDSSINIISSSSRLSSSSSDRHNYNDKSSSSYVRSSSSIAIDDGEDGDLLDSRDGKVYKTVIIENQVWMAENLRTRLIIDQINNASLPDELCDNDTCVYYSMPTDDICPAGFRVPSASDWNTLRQNTGDKARYLKSRDFLGDGAEDGEDTYGFSAKAVGFADINERLIYGFDQFVAYWTDNGDVMFLNSNSDLIQVSQIVAFPSDDMSSTILRMISSSDYFSVRCVRTRK